MKIEVRGAPEDEAAVALARTTRELRKVSGMVEELERVVSLAIAHASQAGADQIVELQNLDHIQQKILGVADFLDALGRSMPSEWRVDAFGASRCVLLAELGAKLGGVHSALRAPAGARESYEIF